MTYLLLLGGYTLFMFVMTTVLMLVGKEKLNDPLWPFFDKIRDHYWRKKDENRKKLNT